MARYGARGRLDLDLPKAKLSRENLREAAAIFSYLRPYRGLMAAAIGAMLFSSLCGLAFPFLAGSLMDVATRGANASGPGWFPRNINTIAFILLGILALQACCTFFHTTSITKVGQSALADLRRDTYARLISLPMSFFARRRVGELASRLSADLSQIEWTLIMSVPQFFRQGLMLLGGVVLVAATSGRLILVMLVALPPVIVLSATFGRVIRRNARDVQDKLADSGTIVEETLQGILNVKAFVNEAFEIERYGRAMDGLLASALRGARLRGAFIATMVFALFATMVLVLWSAASLLRSGTITIGEMTRFVLYTAFVAGAMSQLADLYSQLQKAVGATQRVRELLSEDPEFDIPRAAHTRKAGGVASFPISPNASKPAQQPGPNGSSRQTPNRSANDPDQATSANGASRALRGLVEFREVHFRYPARPEVEVLKGVSFTVNPGEKLALVGPSGSGKSTIISLLLRFYDPEPGLILVDGKPAREYPLDWLRNQMSIVPQETLLFGGSILENIAYGRPGASLELVMEASRQAHAHEFVSGFPEGYQTLVGDRGIKLSGGQRQRVAIARAILKDPSILILDEATSSLDSESERLVELALNRLMENRTTIIIAHRLSTVRRADRILVIKDGMTLESGTHAELNSLEDGLYRRLSTLQAGLK